MKENLLDCIGNTPVFPLKHLNNTQCEINLKLESYNPGGSIKDRIAKYMIEKAFEEGKLVKNGVVIEPSSGNAGIGIAMICAFYGLRCIIAMPESMSMERRKLIQGYGAELVLTHANQGMTGAVQKAEELAKSIENAFMPSQFTNVHAVNAHYESTGPEIFAKFGQDLDYLITGVGTGSTISGCGLFLKEQIPHIKIVAIEPQDSPLLSQNKSGPHNIQGIGTNFIPEVLRRDILDEIVTVSTDDAINTARLLQSKEGIICGISSGANVSAALKLAARPQLKGKRIVTFICDSGERYLSTSLYG